MKYIPTEDFVLNRMPLWVRKMIIAEKAIKNFTKEERRIEWLCNVMCLNGLNTELMQRAFIVSVRFHYTKESETLHWMWSPCRLEAPFAHLVVVWHPVQRFHQVRGPLEDDFLSGEKHTQASEWRQVVLILATLCQGSALKAVAPGTPEWC